MRKLFITAICLFSFSAFADQQPEANNNEPNSFNIKQDKSSGKCVPTPGLNYADHYPGRNEVITKNNLALTTGKAVYAKGQILHIYGRVMDKNCVPVSNAIVDIWHKDAEGKYISTTANERANPYPLFTGSGRAVTDNMGHFSFTTIFPGVEYNTNDEFLDNKNSKKTPHIQAPNINFRITHESFGTLNTKIFFERDARNKYDDLFKSISPWWQNQIVARVTISEDSEKGLEIEKDFILDGKMPYKKY